MNVFSVKTQINKKGCNHTLQPFLFIKFYNQFI